MDNANTEEAQKNENSGSLGFSAWLATITLLALGLRLYAARDCFWLDEIIAYFLAMNALSVKDIFFGIQMEHHFLITLEMWLVGDHLNWFWYRLPSILTGTGLVVLSGITAKQRSHPAIALTVATVTAVSYPLVVFSSEARGYAPAAFFSLLAFHALEMWIGTNRKTSLGLYWCAMTAALLYHSTAICVLLSLVLWSAVRTSGRNGGLIKQAVPLAFVHSVPFLVFGVLYITVMRHWQTMGGDVRPVYRVLCDTISLSLGVPANTALLSACLPFGIIIAAAIATINRIYRRSSTWVLYLIILPMPLIMLFAAGRTYVYVRYFVVFFPFFYLMLCELANDCLCSKRLTLAFVTLATLAIAGNTLMSAEFLRVGRGNHLAALRHMVDNTAQTAITVGGDHAFRNETTLRFYARYLPPSRKITYLTRPNWPANGPDWSIIQSSCMEPFIPEPIIQTENARFHLKKTYPCSTLSGLNWHLYRNEHDSGQTSCPHPSL